MKNIEKLAVLGGNPVRSNAFASPAVIDEDEERMILEVVKSKEFSRFMGSPSLDIEQQLVMSSADAVDHNKQYFSFLGGKMVKTFEANFANAFGAKFAISVSSATSGLSTALAACGVGPGDEVITTCLSFNATATSILVFNSIPVFVDVSPEDFCLDLIKVEKAITPRTKAILVVHLLGHAVDMDRVMAIAKKHNLSVIEDCAQALGTTYNGKRVGTIGHAGVYSFQETKNMTTGEGGMIVTNDPIIAKRSRLIRNHGESVPDENTPIEDLENIIGFNFRMTELTAALGIAQLRKLDENNRVRNENASFLIKELVGLKGLSIPRVVTQPNHVVHVLPFFYDKQATGIDRSVILETLRKEGIPVGSGYLRLMPENPLFSKKIAYGKSGCPYSCHGNISNVNYSLDQFPVATSLIKEKFIWFYHVNRPNTLRDMNDVVCAFNKVWSGLEDLATYKSTQTQKIYKW